MTRSNKPPPRTSKAPPAGGSSAKNRATSPPKRRETVEVELDWVELRDKLAREESAAAEEKARAPRESTRPSMQRPKGDAVRPPPIPGVQTKVPLLPGTPSGELRIRNREVPVRRNTVEVELDWVELVPKEEAKAEPKPDAKIEPKKRHVPIPREEEDDAPKSKSEKSPRSDRSPKSRRKKR